jgi:hypothetical protein
MRDDRHAEELSEELAQRVDRAAPDPASQFPFFSVPTARFVFFNLITFGLYQLWWFYKNWGRVKERTGKDLSPFWRAVFSPLFCFQFVRTVRSTSEKVAVQAPLSVGLITAGYLVLLMCERLPDPYWWVSVLSFVPLLPVQRHITQLHEAMYPGFDSNAAFGKGHVITLLICTPLTALAVAGTFSPPSKALRGAELPDSYRETLIDLGHIEADERVLFFYSGGILSIEEEGNILTNRRVVSYETGWSDSAPYASIADVDVVWSDTGFGNTVITVNTVDERAFRLNVSAEEGRDEEFFETLESMRNLPVTAE